MSKRLAKAKLGNSSLSQGKYKFSLDADQQEVEKLEPCDNIAMYTFPTLCAICTTFGLNQDDYILRKRPEPEKIEAEVPQSMDFTEVLDKIEDLDEKIVLLGKAMSNIETLTYILAEMRK